MYNGRHVFGLVIGNASDYCSRDVADVMTLDFCDRTGLKMAYVEVSANATARNSKFYGFPLYTLYASAYWE